MTQRREVIGKVPAWELWVRSVQEEGNRGRELLEQGAFTLLDFTAKTKWTRGKAERYLAGLNLKSELAADPRYPMARKQRFYFPPKP